MKHIVQKSASWAVGLLVLAMVLPALGFLLVRDAPVARAGGKLHRHPLHPLEFVHDLCGAEQWLPRGTSG